MKIDPKLAKSHPISDTNRNGFDFDRRRTVLPDVNYWYEGLGKMFVGITGISMINSVTFYA